MAKSKGIEKNCPFCGSYVDLKLKVVRPSKYNGHNTTSQYHVECGVCGAKGGERKSAEEAIAAWDHRSEESK